DGVDVPARPASCRQSRGGQGLVPRRAISPPVALDALIPPSVRLVLLAGKGGVGKTTCAAALALALGERAPARRVLVLSTDPAHSLGDVLEMPVGDDVRRVRAGSRAFSAREVDAGRLLTARRAAHLDAVQEVFDALRGGSAFDPAFDR